MNLVPFLLDNMRSFPLPKIQSPVLKTLGNLIEGKDEHLKNLIAMDFITRLFGLLTCKNEPAVAEALFIFSNMITNNLQVAFRIVFNPDMILIINFLNTPNTRLNKEAIYIIANALVQKNMEITNKLLTKYQILSVILLLLKETQDQNLLYVLLRCVRYIFESLSEVLNNDQ